MEAYIRRRVETLANTFGDTPTPHHGQAATLMAQNEKRPNVKSQWQTNGRKLSPREWARLQGFPDTWHLYPVNTHAYRHLGNSVPIPMITHAARPLIMHLTHLAK